VRRLLRRLPGLLEVEAEAAPSACPGAPDHNRPGVPLESRHGADEPLAFKIAAGVSHFLVGEPELRADGLCVNERPFAAAGSLEELVHHP
jgi:hypothetical protein